MLYDRKKALMSDVLEICCVKTEMRTIPMIYKGNAICIGISYEVLNQSCINIVCIQDKIKNFR